MSRSASLALDSRQGFALPAPAERIDGTQLLECLFSHGDGSSQACFYAHKPSDR